MARFSRLLAIALIGAAVPAAAATRVTQSGEAKLAKALEGRVAGKPVDCINLRTATSSQVYDGAAIVYEDGRTLYVNRPKIGADSLRSDDILVTKTFSSQLCSIDTVRLVDRGSRFEHGFVGLDTFVPYVKPKQ